MVIFRQKVYTRNVLLIGVVAAAFGAKSIWRLAIGNADSVKFMLIDFLKICIFIHLFIFIYLFILIYLFINIYLLLFYDILCIFAKTGNPSIDLVSSSQSLNVSLCRSTTQQVPPNAVNKHLCVESWRCLDSIHAFMWHSRIHWFKQSFQPNALPKALLKNYFQFLVAMKKLLL